MIQIISGSKLKIMLKRKRILQKDICENLNMNQATVSRYFTNDMSMPATFILRVAKFANFSIDELIETYEIGDISPQVLNEQKGGYDRSGGGDPSKRGGNGLIDTEALEAVIGDLQKRLTDLEKMAGELKE